MEVYDNLDAFYGIDEERRRSGEADYGVHWRDEQEWPRWRISYVRDTHEFYAVQMGGAGRVEVWGRLPGELFENGEPDRWHEPADDILEGWEHECEKPNGLRWARERVKEATA